MPTLPGKILSQAHYDRVVAAFPGATSAEKAEAYDRWLTNRLIERVQMVESARIDVEAFHAKKEAMDALVASLPARAQEPTLP